MARAMNRGPEIMHCSGIVMGSWEKGKEECSQRGTTTTIQRYQGRITVAVVATRTEVGEKGRNESSHNCPSPIPQTPHQPSAENTYFRHQKATVILQSLKLWSLNSGTSDSRARWNSLLPVFLLAILLLAHLFGAVGRMAGVSGRGAHNIVARVTVGLRPLIVGLTRFSRL